jgi:carboxylate-amine ligase
LYRTELLRENKWRAQRYGIEGELIDFGRGKSVPVAQIWDETLEFLDDVLDGLGTRREVEYVRHILQHGTSADRQLATYYQALDDGCTSEEAFRLVMDRLMDETISH